MSIDSAEVLAQMKDLISNKIKPLTAKISQLTNSVKDKYIAMETLAKQTEQDAPENRKELEEQVAFMSREVNSMLLEIRVVQDQANKFTTQLLDLTKSLDNLMK